MSKNFNGCPSNIIYAINQFCFLIKLKKKSHLSFRIGYLDMESSDKIKESYGLVNIFYGSTNGNSKQLAYEFSEEAEQFQFIPKITCLGDFTPQTFINSKFSVFFLSTYGAGGPTEDSQAFFEWLTQLAADKKPLLAHLKFIMFGLGNSNFEFFAGMSKKVREMLLELGAHQIHPFTINDAKISRPIDTYTTWRSGLFHSVLRNYLEDFPKKKYSVQDLKKLANPYYVTLHEEINHNWESVAHGLKLKHEVVSYLSCPKAKVLQVRQIRKGETEGRETLFVRIQLPQGIQLSPACNVELFPQNPESESHKGSIKVNSHSAEEGLPFPEMPLKQFFKILNVSQRITKSFLQDVLISCTDPAKRLKYSQLLKNDAEWVNCTLTCGQVAEDLKADLAQMLQLGINTPRLYTLAGWHPNQIHLLVSVLKKDGKYGLTSDYLRRFPKQIKLRSSGSHFKLPASTETTIVMIANGSGMAPFRSLLHYNRHLKQQGKPTHPLILYYGCQRLGCDYYFEEEWVAAQKQGLVEELIVATSREGPKLYIQKILMDQKLKLKDLLIDRKATFFVCGSEGMGKEINNVLIEVYKSVGDKPYQSLMKVRELEKTGRLVKEIFG